MIKTKLTRPTTLPKKKKNNGGEEGSRKGQREPQKGQYSEQNWEWKRKGDVWA